MTSPIKSNTLPLKTDCIGKCYRLKGYCTGCGRTSEEIFDWIILSNSEKKAILETVRHDNK